MAALACTIIIDFTCDQTLKYLLIDFWFRLALQDQTGKEVDLPKAEKDALVMAMSLHQKGRAAMKKGKFELGLVLLLEATEEFDNCRAEILNVIDNYGKLSFFFEIL